MECLLVFQVHRGCWGFHTGLFVLGWGLRKTDSKKRRSIESIRSRIFSSPRKASQRLKELTLTPSGPCPSKTFGPASAGPPEYVKGLVAGAAHGEMALALDWDSPAAGSYAPALGGLDSLGW